MMMSNHAAKVKGNVLVPLSKAMLAALLVAGIVPFNVAEAQDSLSPDAPEEPAFSDAASNIPDVPEDATLPDVPKSAISLGANPDTTGDTLSPSTAEDAASPAAIDDATFPNASENAAPPYVIPSVSGESPRSDFPQPENADTGPEAVAPESEAQSTSITLRFDAAGGKGEMPDKEIDLQSESGLQWNLPACAFKKDGFEFAGWSIANSPEDGPLIPDKHAFTGTLCVIKDGEAKRVELDLRAFEREGAIDLVAMWIQLPQAEEAAGRDQRNDPAQPDSQNQEAEEPEQASVAALVLQPDGGEALVLPAGTVAYEKTVKLMAAATFSHASVHMTAVSNGGSSRSATANTSWASVNTVSGDWCLYDFTLSISGGGTTGGIQYQFKYLNNGSFTWTGTVSNGGHAVSWNTPSIAVKIWLTGNYASAYTIDYNVHGHDQSNNVPHAQNGAESSDAGAAIDGLGLKLIPKSYNHYVSVRYQNADGSWGSYSTVRTSSVAYGSMVSAWSRAQDATYQAASMSSYTAGFSNTTKQVSVYRRTATNTIQVRYQNADGSWGSYSNASSGTDRVGQVRSWSRAQDATYQAASASITGTASNQTKQVSVYRRTATNTIQVRYQNADGSWGSYSNASSGTDRVGQVRSWSREADATYQAASASITGTASGQTKQVSVGRNSYTTSFDTQGGSAVASSSRLAGSKFAVPDEPVKDGYVFEGWWTAADGGALVTSATDTPSADVTYYAHWAPSVRMPAAGLPLYRGFVPESLLAAAAAITCLAGSARRRRP